MDWTTGDGGAATTVDRAGHEQRSQADEMNPESAGPQILLVEDDSSLSGLITLELQRGGMRVTATDSSVDAIMRLQHARFRVLILDIMLNGSSGLYVIEALRDVAPAQRPRVVIITGARSAVLNTIDRSLVRAVFFKPLEVSSLTAYVKSISLL